MRLLRRLQMILCDTNLADMLIAATAQAHQLTLVTRNGGNFADCSIALLNPFR
jgi:predicted nucleic acid-binding protein